MMNIPLELNLISLNNDVLLPGGLVKMPLSSSKNLQMMKELLSTEEHKVIGVVPCLDKSDIIEGAIATAAIVVDCDTLRWTKKTFLLSLLGLSRIRIEKIKTSDNYPVATVSVIDDCYKDIRLDDEEVNITLLNEFKSLFFQMTGSFEMMQYISVLMKYKKLLGISFPKSGIVDMCAAIVAKSFEEKIELLKITSPMERIKKLNPMINRYLNAGKNVLNHSMLNTGDSQIKDRMLLKIGLLGVPSSSSPIFKNIKRHSFHQPSGSDEDDELEDKLKLLKLPEVAAKVVNRELNQLKRLSHHHMDYAVHRNYLELIAELPWNNRSNETINIAKSKQDLEDDHHGMDDVKKRIVEFLAVRQLKSDLKGPILCFVGAPGVGKTSVGRSIANSLGRKFHRISLGGVCNHSDIRGHRKTYVGAMPGRIIQALRTVGVNNPVILLDEIDKIGKSVHGDPASALLEVLDSEQNSNFVDHYLNIPFDLSEVIFIATANITKTIPPALKDRLEIIQMSGYTLEEKKNIAVKHLLPKQLRDHGLSAFAVTIPEDVISHIISGYTHEAGVRGLDRKLAAICRRAAVNATCANADNIHADNTQSLLVTRDVLEDILGPILFEEGLLGWRDNVPGVAIGLCWTPVGGNILIVEATRVYGGSNALVLTGHLGKVMKESAKLAFNWFRSVAYKYGLDDYLENVAEISNVHVHFPAGAVSKDGPSAGITVAVALISLFSCIPISSELAMTGELTLNGSVLPVGGIKEKLVAAHNAGVKTVIIPAKSQKHLAELSKNVLDDLEIIPVNNMEEVIKAAFNGQISLQKNSVLSSKL